VNDLRNSKVEDVVKELENYGCICAFHDPMVEQKEIFRRRNISVEQARKEGFKYALLAVRHKALEKRLPELRKRFTVLELLR
jgi:UDP-N-acetyl-D-mannosaminuronate dehydrogenase